jgi:hypothetical protein
MPQAERNTTQEASGSFFFSGGASAAFAFMMNPTGIG